MRSVLGDAPIATSGRKELHDLVNLPTAVGVRARGGSKARALSWLAHYTTCRATEAAASAKMTRLPSPFGFLLAQGRVLCDPAFTTRPLPKPQQSLQGMSERPLQKLRIDRSCWQFCNHGNIGCTATWCTMISFFSVQISFSRRFQFSFFFSCMICH